MNKFVNPWPPVHPVDETFYNIELKDGCIIENVEYWAFGGGFGEQRKGGNHKYVGYGLEEIKSFELIK